MRIADDRPLPGCFQAIAQLRESVAQERRVMAPYGDGLIDAAMDLLLPGGETAPSAIRQGRGLRDLQKSKHATIEGSRSVLSFGRDHHLHMGDANDRHSYPSSPAKPGARGRA